ncbi:MAG TPA: hypothetical protein VFH95_05475 [Candidatus Kapabacteria bacterium]|nr:hypothetical protein [Candidatus Kapabacteria bacterium]
MTYEPITTRVEEGKIVLPPDVDWPNGTIVRVEPMSKARPTVWEVLDKYDGIANDLPEDLAENLDHYIHGHPKK